jgi:hypothetical protein
MELQEIGFSDFTGSEWCSLLVLGINGVATSGFAGRENYFTWMQVRQPDSTATFRLSRDFCKSRNFQHNEPRTVTKAYDARVTCKGKGLVPM